MIVIDKILHIMRDWGLGIGDLGQKTKTKNP
jgi:hypothetical protein